MEFLAKLKQPQVLAFIITILVQIALRNGVNVSEAQIAGWITNGVDLLTFLAGLWVAHQSNKGSIL